MGRRRTGLNGLAYLGVEAIAPPDLFTLDRDPTTQDYYNFNIGTFWLNLATQDLFFLSNKDRNNDNVPVATWSSFGGGSGATDFTTDNGIAMVSSDNINILGGTLISTSGSGDTVTIDLDSGTDGQVIIGSTSGSSAYATLASADGSVTITNGSNSIDLSASSPGITWNEVTDTSEDMVAMNGYVANNAGLVTLTLPATCAFGDTIRVAGLGAGGWKVAQNASQVIHFGDMDTTTGAGGSLASTNRYDCIELLCVATNTDFLVLSSIGNLTVV